ncbi:metallophosphoesterase family protein [Promicromonospora sp. NPDC090134]|uniref:metallophosphoesterase family protein n=1 Tax=Promicromonospora sp. NPDC090134 TaxID=3364408 RepID=UPI0038270EA2
MSGHTSSEVGAVAVLSDVHGVLPVLEAVLAEPDVAAADRVVVTGDHAAGPQPVEVLDRLRALGERAVLVRGNADRELVALARGGTTDIPDPVAPWAASRLRPDDVALLAGLPHPVELTVRGFGRVVFCHGTPRDDEEVVLVDSSLERWADVLGGLDADVTTVVMGHTHMPFVRLVDRRLCVNPGSVGMPYGRAGGSWALLRDGQVEVRHTPVGVEAAVTAVAAGSAYPAAEEWARQYVTSANSDADALRVFGPRDGRPEAPTS